MALVMQELFPEGFWSGLTRFAIGDGSRGLWPYVITEDMVRQHKECLKIARAQKVQNWTLNDYDLCSYHSKWTDTTTPYVRYSGDPLKKWYSDVSSMIMFDDHQSGSLGDAFVKGCFKMCGREDVLIDKELNNFYCQYLRLIDPYMSKEVALQVLGSIKYGSRGVETIGGGDSNRKSLTSLIVSMGEILDSLVPTKACHRGCDGGFMWVWGLTIQAERVYSSLRDYPQAVGKFGISKIPNEPTLATKLHSDGSLGSIRGLWSVEFISQSNAMVMLKSLRDMGYLLDITLSDKAFNLARSTLEKSDDLSYLV